jgi:hypothetical protein
LHGYEIKKREKRHRNEVKRNKHGEDLNIDRFRGFGPEFEGRDLEVDEFDSPSQIKKNPISKTVTAKMR